MNEELKLKEAKYFYSRMVSEVDKCDNFHYNLSAFASAARSVLQYALKEAKKRRPACENVNIALNKTKLCGWHWYNSHFASSKTLIFFKDERNLNIHEQPVQANQHTFIQVTDVIRASERILIKKFDQNGQFIEEYSSESSELPSAHNIPPKVTHQFFFTNWRGAEDVLQLCDLHLNELQYVVEDGQNNGFLTK